MAKNNATYEESVKDATKLFENRVFKHTKDGLFITSFSKMESIRLHVDALRKINALNRTIK
jgi:hypothetical protein